MHHISAVMACLTNQDGEVSQRKVHYCPACDMLHFLPESWQFDGNLERPTFSPSFRQMSVRDGKDCHYFIRDGQIVWCGDSWHGRTGTEPMVPLASIEWINEWYDHDDK